MNDANIIAQLKLLGRDMQDLPPSEIVKAEALVLLASESPSVGGGVLNQWFNRSDGRNRRLIRRAITLVGLAYRQAHNSDNGQELIRISEKLSPVSLSPADIDTLLALHKKEALSIETAVSRETLLRAMKSDIEGKHMFDRLKQLGFVQAKRGGGGGFFLTQSGIEEAEQRCTHL